MTKFSLALVILLICFTGSACFAQLTKPREWVDSTGKNKVVATFIEVKDGIVYLKTARGKTIKIPVEKLRPEDQELVKDSENPFEEADPEELMESDPGASGRGSNEAAETGSGSGKGWNSPLVIDWEEIEELDRSFDGEWKLELPEQSELGFTAKRATLNKTNNFFEKIRRVEINPIAKRAVVGYTVNFSVPKPLSRLAVIDLVTGKANHTESVEADMWPLCLLNDGNTVLMYGSSNEREGHETPDQIQLWRVNGKKIVRTKSWVPFPDEVEKWGKMTNGSVKYAVPVQEDKLILLSENGQLVCIDVETRKPYWHTKLTSGGSVDASIDRSLLAVIDDRAIMIIDPQTGSVKAAAYLEGQPHVAWPQVRWSPSGKKLLVGFTNELRVLDLTNGKWTHQTAFTGMNVAWGISYPHEDYALIQNELLVHLPSQIKVCSYNKATSITTLGGMSFIGMQEPSGGFIVPAKMPHPAAEAILAQAEKDPSVFLVHPGVEVSIDTAGAGQWASQAKQLLTKAATASGYKVVANSPISIVASITGPKQEAISFIAAGAYIANVYQSNIALKWEGKDLWTTGGSNIPGGVQTKRGQSIQEALDEYGKVPNLGVFEHTEFPKMLQKPSAETKEKGAQSDALMFSTFTMQGLVDSHAP
ncbi:MAG: PQQ-binding-like beta-propeller repeat protein [Planctomycetaceae bacterium]|nr:PQQ-binding-like beta-propeller repeat protein [Planctomycetaceae bacterium]